MGYLADEILNVCHQFKYNANILSFSDSQNHYSQIVNKFASNNSNNKVYPLWELLKDSIGIHDPNAWSWISEFITEQPVLIFFEPSDDKSMVCLQNGSFLSEIIGECFGFIFYVSDLNYNYLISFTDHDVLIGVGSAKEWIQSKLENK